MRSLIAGPAVLLAVCCSSGIRTPTVKTRASFCLVTAEELASYEATSLYDALKALRPGLLRANLRGEPPIVIVDGIVTTEPLLALQNMRVGETFVVRRLSASSATQRYGLHQSNSVLEVVTKRSDRTGETSTCS